MPQTVETTESIEMGLTIAAI